MTQLNLLKKTLSQRAFRRVRLLDLASWWSFLERLQWLECGSHQTDAITTSWSRPSLTSPRSRRLVTKCYEPPSLLVKTMGCLLEGTAGDVPLLALLLVEVLCMFGCFKRLIPQSRFARSLQEWLANSAVNLRGTM